jgi:glycerophosphoryl diester phosphodiesterase
VIAHRGAPRHAPENTLAAFRRAAGDGADAIELDARLTSDGAVVVLHDSTLDRTTDGTGPVSAHSLTEVKRLDAGLRFSPGFAGERIPLLEEVFEAVGRRLLINIELKVLDTLSSGLGPDTVKAVRAHSMADQVVISSFNPFALRRAKQAGPEIECALLLANDLPGWMRWGVTRRYSRADGLHPDFVMADETYVARARKHGLPVRVWTVDDEARMRRLIALGVDAIITNVPDALAAIV